MTTPTPEHLRDACEVLSARDAVLAQAYAEIGLPTWRTTSPTYSALARIVVYQLISTKAADAIWARLITAFPDFSAKVTIASDPDELLACGLSRPKRDHLKAIAEAVETGALSFDAMVQQSPDETRRALLQVRGIGPWTADTFMMNALGHLDAFPHGDVGLIEAYKRLSGAEDRLHAKAFSALAEAWRPYRAVAAHLLYDWYNANRS